MSNSSQSVFDALKQSEFGIEVPYYNYFSEDARPGLSSYLDKTIRGNSDVVRTPFAKSKEQDEVLDEWSIHLKKLEKEWPSLIEFENDLRSKVGPLSVQAPLIDRLESIESYFTDVSLPQDPIDQDAIRCVLREFHTIQGIRVRTGQRTVNRMKLSTSSGNPFFTKRRNVVDQTVPVTVSTDYLRVKQSLTNHHNIWDAAAIIGWRGQEGGPNKSDVKQRVVWMFPFGVNIAELSVYQPLIERCQDKNLIAPWIGLSAVDRRITQLFETKRPEDYVICTDFTKFDQHFNRACQNAAYDILSRLLSHSAQEERWLEEVFPAKYNIPLICALTDDKLLCMSGEHGMASGSGGTNADETLTHRALQYEAALWRRTNLNQNSMCLGDDGVLTFPGIQVEDVVQAYTSHGLEMNETKQYVSKHDCVFLRRWHHEDYQIAGECVGVYSTYRALGRLMYQERFYDPEVWGPKMVALRQLSILENCKYHPLRDEFAKFCMKRDKYRLGIDIPGFLEDIGRIASEATNLLPGFMSYTQQLDAEGNGDSYGIENWWIVQFLKSQR
uniref:RNA-dependent RNA polymerase n=1 Tax=Picobirnavirus bovine/RUBV-P/IND/2005 TaxID=658402 RepID=C7DTL0_9VIRU|nr:RNA-dependent RNA polymerase [Picobirnavirus bovine/RUBV-P/IND/2005]